MIKIKETESAVVNSSSKKKSNKIMQCIKIIHFLLEKEEHVELTAMDEIIKANEIHG